MPIQIAHAELTSMSVDAIVNPANSQGVMTSGLSASIRYHGGDRIHAEVKECVPIAVGAAIVTSGGDLPARHVIHAPIMEEPGQRIGVENVRRAARAALLAAEAHKFQVIAFPGMGLDNAVPLEESARAIVEEIRAHKKPFPETIYLVDSRHDMVQAFEEAVNNSHQAP
jgi:O-acetyl-ADP-ribose deacetylase (regulator of RNase III)